MVLDLSGTAGCVVGCMSRVDLRNIFRPTPSLTPDSESESFFVAAKSASCGYVRLQASGSRDGLILHTSGFSLQASSQGWAFFSIRSDRGRSLGDENNVLTLTLHVSSPHPGTVHVHVHVIYFERNKSTKLIGGKAITARME